MKKNKNLVEKIKIHIINSSPHDFINITVTEIARLFRITVPYLSHLFKKKHGIKLSKFLLNEKISRSRLLLNNNLQLTINEIAAAVGYSSTDYFIMIFKKQTGITPSNYRSITRRFYGSKTWRVGAHERRLRIERRRYLSNKVNTNHHIIKNNRRLNVKDRRKSWFIM